MGRRRRRGKRRGGMKKRGTMQKEDGEEEIMEKIGRKVDVE